MRTTRTYWTAAVICLMTLCATWMSARSGMSSTSATPEQVQALLQGSWLLTVTPAPGLITIQPFRALMTYTADGGLIETDTAVIATVAPGYATSPGHGAWVERGGEFTTTAVKLVVDKNGQFVGTLRIQGITKLNPALDGYSGSGKLELLNPNGVVVTSGAATLQATRIRA